MFCGALILFIAPLQVAGQNPEPEKAQTENVRPLFYFITVGPSGLSTTVWVPFTAKKVKRVYILSSPGEKLILESTELVARNRNGWLYTGDIPGTPSIKWLRGTLLDPRARDIYEIDYEHKSVTLHRSLSPAPLEPPTGDKYKHVPLDRSLGSRMISGVMCIGIKERTSRGDTQTTETWVAPSLNYEVVETTVLDPKKIRVEIVLEDIQAGTSPDPEFFRIPEGFQKVYIGPL